MLVDVDHTLLLDNTTERFLDLARPRWLAAVLLDLLDAVAPWRMVGGAREHWRDPLGVMLIVALMPWTWLRWRGGAGRRMGQRTANRELVAALAEIDPRHVVLVSLGTRALIEPAVADCGLRHGELVASPLGWGGARLRRTGKLERLRARYGAKVLERSFAITDSLADADLLEGVAYAHLTRWPDDCATRAQAESYYPFRYIHRVKYPHKGIVRRQMVGEDLLGAWLIFAWFGPQGALRLGPGAEMTFLAESLAVAAWWASFFAVYEIGYEENDRVGALRESRPTLSEYARRPRRVAVGARGWVWGAVLGGGASLIWGVTQGLSTLAILGVGGTWALLLLATRLAFAAFNRVAVHRRVYLFIPLQLAKTFGYAVVATTSLAGALFGLAQVWRQSTNYTIYRYRGDNRSFRRQAHRMLAFVAGLGVVTLATRDATPWLAAQTWALLAFTGYRVVREHIRFSRYRVDARHAAFLEGRSDLRPEEA